MTNSKQLFKQAHAIAKVLEGNYSARLKMAFILIKEKRLVEVNRLVTFDKKGNAIYPVAQPAKPAKSAKKAQPAKPAKESEHVSPIQYDNNLPENMHTLFTDDQCNTIIFHLNSYVTYANKLSGEHLQAKKFQFEDGFKALSKVQDFKDLQFVMVSYFFESMVKKMAWKYIEMGAGYKMLNTKSEVETMQEMSYQNAPSSSGKILDIEVEDVVSELKLRSLERVIDENMFNDTYYVWTALKWAVSNSLRTAMRRATSKTMKVKKVYKSEEYINQKIESQHIESTEKDALNMAIDMGVFTESELFVLELSLDGFTKVEIDRIIEKRSDRTFQSIKKKYRNAMLNA